MYKKTDLHNGLRIILYHMGRMESAAIGIWVNTGSRNESKIQSGISHFLEHLVFKGTHSRTSRNIKEEIEGRGGALNAFTSEEITCYLAKVSGKHIDIALNVLSDMVLNGKLASKDIERERPVIIEEIKMYHDLPNHHVHDILSETMWPNHALGRSIAGNIESVSSITQQDISGYKEKMYVPGNITVAVCGNFDRDTIEKRIDRIFYMKPKMKIAGPPKFRTAQSMPGIKIMNKQTAQTHIAMGLHTFGRMHKDRYALGLLHTILGANMSSRLFDTVREKKGLAYEIGTEIKTFKETGAFVINAGIEHKKTKEAISVIIKELKKIKDQPVPQRELKRAKEFVKIQLLLALENTMPHMLWAGEYTAATGKIPDKNKAIKKIDAVSVEDVQRVSSSIFKTSNINMAAIGPLEDNDKKVIERELVL